MKRQSSEEHSSSLPSSPIPSEDEINQTPTKKEQKIKTDSPQDTPSKKVVAWTPEKRAKFLDKIITAGMQAVGRETLAEEVRLIRDTTLSPVWSHSQTIEWSVV
jgi:hypothetical protein